MIKILVIDDDKSLRRLYNMLIGKRYRDACVAEASNGEEGLVKTLGTDYSAIITDINMPIMDGIEFYQKLKEKRPCLAERVCFLSAGLDDNLFHLQNEGCPHLLKPFSISDFYRTVDTILGFGDVGPHIFQANQ